MELSPHILAVIPARWASTRLRGKPMAKIGDKTLIQWVYEATQNSPLFKQVIVATDSEQIYSHIVGNGGNAEMTQRNHRTGSDRVAEVVRRHPEAEIVANVQGDQPFVSLHILKVLLAPLLEDASVEMATVACPLVEDEMNNPNVVKVVTDKRKNALYFSRAPIPYQRPGVPAQALHHLGIYAFRRDFLLRYNKLAPTPLEQTEGLEQLRALEHGHRIVVEKIKAHIFEVNTVDDLQRAREMVQAKSQMRERG
jgi:3-deoxy-manno-octulosonate cytidylyltransferase (CMP-KDO synthetase)